MKLFTETKTGFKGQLKRYFSKAAKSDLEAAGEIAVSLNVGRIIPLGRENAVKRTTLSNQLGRTDREVRKWIEGLRREIEDTLNVKMKEFNDSLFTTKKKPPHVHFNAYNSYKFETPDNTGTGSNFKGMIVYDLAVLFTTALPALAHDSLLFKNLGKDVEDGIFRIYNSTKKQIFIAYDKQGDCRPETQKILEDNCVLRLSTNNCELYGRSWDTEE